LTLTTPRPDPWCIVSADHNSARPGEDFASDLSAAAQAGFTMLLWRQDGCLPGGERLVPDSVVEGCRRAGLSLAVEVDVTRFPLHHPLVEAHPALFAIRRRGERDAPVDPRGPMPAVGEARARLRQAEAAPLLETVEAALLELADAGIAGFRLARAERIRPDFLRRLIAALRRREPGLIAFAGVGGMSRAEAAERAETGLEFLVSSFGWWDFRAPWLVEETEELRCLTPLVAEPGPEQLRSDNPAAVGRVLCAGAALADGLIAPLGIIHLCPEALSRAAAVAKRTAPYRGEMRRLTGSATTVSAFLRADEGDVRTAGSALLTLINTSDQPQSAPDPHFLSPAAGFAFASECFAKLRGCEVRVAEGGLAEPVLLPPS
jgi:starch synthase (maltosyl-transferring)